MHDSDVVAKRTIKTFCAGILLTPIRLRPLPSISVVRAAEADHRALSELRAAPLRIYRRALPLVCTENIIRIN